MLQKIGKMITNTSSATL